MIVINAEVNVRCVMDFFERGLPISVLRCMKYDSQYRKQYNNLGMGEKSHPEVVFILSPAQHSGRQPMNISGKQTGLPYVLAGQQPGGEAFQTKAKTTVGRHTVAVYQ